MPSQTTAGPFSNVTPQVAKMMEQLTKGYFGFMPSELWTPTVNLYETEGAYHVCVDLAGVEKDKIDITLQEQRLFIRGARPVPQCLATRAIEETRPGEPPRLRIHLMEIDHGAFAREVELPDDVIQQEISAKYVDGMLWIELPKK